MIFISTGSRKFKFDRLIKKIDELVGKGIITEEVFAQIAETDYIPKNIKYKRYINQNEFAEYQEKADLIISHAGTGALIGALKKQKQVIAVPRLAKFNEHSDDHQIQIAEALSKEGYLRMVLDMNELDEVIKLAYTDPVIKKYDKPSNVIKIIDEFLAKQ